jgi:hypothetical protein
MGDRVPLLRLAAESLPPTDEGDAAGFISEGAEVAAYCYDNQFFWDKQASLATRRAQYNAALAALPPGATAPFSLGSWATYLRGPVTPGPEADSCIGWPAPARLNPPYASNAVFTQTPALLLNGDFDLVTPNQVQTLLSRFPKGHFVEVANAGHFPAVWSPCAQALTLHFIATLRVGDTRCASDTKAPMHAFGAFGTNVVMLRGVDRFPRTAAQALPAVVDPSAQDSSTITDRQVARVAWSTIEDAFMQSMRMSGTTGRGLRGGSFRVSRTTAAVTIAYRNAQFSDDVTVSGTATFNPVTFAVTARVRVAVRDGQDGNLSFSGALFHPEMPFVQVTGTFGTRIIALRTTAN